MRIRLVFAFVVAALILAQVPLLQAHTPPRACESFDHNQDHRVTASDALVVLRAAVGLGCHD